jgi:hypothetical protein
VSDVEENGVTVLYRNVLKETEKYYEKYIILSLGFEAWGFMDKK